MSVPPQARGDDAERRPEEAAARPYDRADHADGDPGADAARASQAPASEPPVSEAPASQAPASEAPASEPPAGSHRAERPVPRSSLSEERSAPYLMEGPEPHQSDPYTTVTPATEGGDRGGAGSDERPSRAGTRAAEDEDRRGTHDADRTVVLDDASDDAAPRSRTRAHLLSVLVTLLLIPVAWYLIADVGARLTLPADNPWESGERNVAALVELGAGLLALALALLMARWSSVGAIITGALVLLLGLPFVVVPTLTQEYLEPVTDRLGNLNDLGGNLAHHLEASGSTGRFVAYGLALILVGVVSHGARRQGRREERAAAAHERHRAAGQG